MSTSNKILCFANLALTVALIAVIACQGLPLRGSPGWEYKDLVANLLAIVTIVLAFIGLAVALAAIWGWQTISQGAAQKATNAATDRIGAYLGDEAFKPRLDALIREHLENIKKANVQDAVVADQAPAPNSDDAAADEEWHDDN